MTTEVRELLLECRRALDHSQAETSDRFQMDRCRGGMRKIDDALAIGDTPVDVAAKEPDFLLHEIGSTYCGPRDRFVVSLIVGYSEEDLNEAGEDLTPESAVRAAVDLVEEEGRMDTQFWVYDRAWKEMRMIERGQAEQSRLDSYYSVD